MVKKFFLVCALFAVVASACAKKEEPKKEDASQPQVIAPEMTPTAPQPPMMGDKKEGISGIQHAPVKPTKGVKLSKDVKERWKVVSLVLTDNTAKTTDTLKMDVGKSVAIKNTGYTLKVEAFVPDYIIYEDYIGSKTNEPNNPAVLVELIGKDKSVVKGWIFKKLPDFNSYKHERFSLVLAMPAETAK